MVYLRVQEAVQQGEVPGFAARLRASWVGGLWLRISPLFERLSIDLSDLLLRATSWVSDQIVGQATNLAKNVLVSVAYFLLMLVALFFFFFRDGEAMMEPARKDTVFERLYTLVGPAFLLLISMLGGLQVYGFLGVFLGPVVLAILFVFVDIYREEYRAVAVSPTLPPPETETAPPASH